MSSLQKNTRMFRKISSNKVACNCDSCVQSKRLTANTCNPTVSFNNFSNDVAQLVTFRSDSIASIGWPYEKRKILNNYHFEARVVPVLKSKNQRKNRIFVLYSLYCFYTCRIWEYVKIESASYMHFFKQQKIRPKRKDEIYDISEYHNVLFFVNNVIIFLSTDH